MSKFLRRSLLIFIIKCFRTIVLIFIVVSTTFRPMCPPAFFGCLSNSRTFMVLRTTSFIESTWISCSDSISHNWVQVLSIPVLLLACSEDWTYNLQMIVSLEAFLPVYFTTTARDGVNTVLGLVEFRWWLDNSEWIFGTYKLYIERWDRSHTKSKVRRTLEGSSTRWDWKVGYRGITLTSIAAKIYNALLRNRIEPKIDNILRKNQNGFRRNRSTTSQILTIRRILEGVRAKNLQATLIFVDFTKAFDSIHRGKMEQILLAYGIPKETVAAITILYRNSKVKVRTPDGDTEYFDIVAGVLQGDTLAPYLFIICLDYVLRTSIDKIKENGLELTKKRSKRYPATTITDADYADDIAILANTSDQAETLLHSLERAAASIGLYVNAHKTEYMCYNQTGDISTLEGTPLKLVDKFTYLGSSVESTEKDIETRLTKAWTAINRLSIIWKSDLTDKMKRSFFQAAVTSILLYGCTTWTLTKRLEKKLDGNYTRMLRAILNKSWQQHPTRHQLYGHLPPITKTIQVRRTRHAGHCWRSRDELIRDVLLWIPTHGRAKAGRPARTYIQQLCEDTGCCPEDLPRAMNDREEWRERVRDICATSAIWWWWLWWWYGRKRKIICPYGIKLK